MPTIEEISDNLRQAFSSTLPNVSLKTGRTNPIVAWWTGEKKEYINIQESRKNVGRVELIRGGSNVPDYRKGTVIAVSYDGLFTEKDLAKMALTGKYSNTRGSTVIVI